MSKEFDKWVFEQCVTKSHEIEGIKAAHGLNVKYINTTTGDEFHLGDKCPDCGADEVDLMTSRTVYLCGSSDYDQRPGTFANGVNCT